MSILSISHDILYSCRRSRPDNALNEQSAIYRIVARS